MDSHRRSKVKTKIAPALKISEAELLQRVIDLAHYTGWRVAHFRPALKKDGTWVTPVAGDGKGFPDLVLAHEAKRRTIFAELKAEDGALTPEQREWLRVLAANEYNEVYRWRPSSWEEVQMVLMSDGQPNKFELEALEL